jgi:four helix bundle suffix protein
MPQQLFDKHGGFRRLHSFTLATIIQLDTLRFCRRFLTHDHREADDKFYDPKGRQYDQMTQAARSGRQNIIEGSERSSTSKDTEMKLTDVARASLSELRGDYEMFILDRGELPWSVHSAEAKAVNAISLDAAAFSDDMVHESAKHALEQRRKYARWLDAADPVVVANAMLIILGRALNMLKSQIAAQGEAFEQTGGFSERLTARRLEAREEQRNAEPSPACPQCEAHAPTKVRERRLLGVLCVSGVQRHAADLTSLTSLTLLTSTRSMRSYSRAHRLFKYDTMSAMPCSVRPSM